MSGSTKAKNPKLNLIFLFVTYLIQNITLITLILTLPRKGDGVDITIYAISATNLIATIPYYLFSNKYSTAFSLNALDFIFILPAIFVTSNEKILGALTILFFVRLITNGQLLVSKKNIEIPYPLKNKYAYFTTKLLITVYSLTPIYIGFIFDIYYLLLYLAYIPIAMIIYLIVNEVSYKKVYKDAIINNKIQNLKPDMEEETKSLYSLLNTYLFLKIGKYLEALAEFDTITDLKYYELSIYFETKTLLTMHLDPKNTDQVIKQNKETIAKMKKQRRKRIEKYYNHILEIYELKKKQKQEDLQSLLNKKNYLTDSVYQETNGITNILEKYFINYC